MIIPQKDTPFLVTLMQTHSSMLLEESKIIIQTKSKPRLSSQIQAQKVIKQKANTTFTPPERLPKVQPLVAVDKEKALLSEIIKPQIKKEVTISIPNETKESVAQQEISLRSQIDVPKATIINQETAAVKAPKTAQIVKTGITISASYAKTNQKPEYPSQSRRYNEEGTVVLTVFVTAEGVAGIVEVKSSSGYPNLDQSAKDAVMHWHFNPATIDGKPIDESYSLSIPFKLNG